MASDVSNSAPSSLNHLVGQRSVIDQVKTALDVAFEDGVRFDHSLLVGGPGLGKTQLASVIAQEMATDFHEVLGQSITSIGDLNALLLGAKDKDIIHIDEAHELPKPLQTGLYLGIDKRTIFINTKNSTQGIPVADFTLLLSTTDEYCLLQPLRDRMKLTLRFEFYNDEELSTLTRHRSHALGWDIDDSIFSLIAQRSRGTPRIALRLLQSCRRVCRSEGEHVITVQHFERACDLEQIDDIGLGPLERQYLSILASGPSRLNVIASILGLPTRTVSHVTEQFLVRSSLIDKDKSGLRQLTGKGLDHVRRS
ncbi:MAG: Holliday junction DNA helicase RuvB C-terminal domain-containing protein [Pirellulaceae bacterium]